MKSGTILMYNCTGEKYFKMKQIFAMLRLRMRTVTPDRYHLTLLELAENQGENAAEAPEAIPETMLVFCGVNSALCNQVLEVLRTANVPQVDLKAILTQENQTWDSLKLYEELKKERESFRQEQEKPQD